MHGGAAVSVFVTSLLLAGRSKVIWFLPQARMMLCSKLFAMQMQALDSLAAALAQLRCKVRTANRAVWPCSAQSLCTQHVRIACTCTRKTCFACYATLVAATS
jgi:hypothetical protein